MFISMFIIVFVVYSCYYHHRRVTLKGGRTLALKPAKLQILEPELGKEQMGSALMRPLQIS